MTLTLRRLRELVARHPKWVLVRIYVDEGESGTTLQHREAFRKMLADADAGKIDLIIVKNISRFALNVVDFLGILRRLAEKKIGVWLESEGIYVLNEDSHTALSFQATIAEQESCVRSRSMETSLRMRRDHGLPLTSVLLGFLKNEDGKLVINPETYKIPKLIFYMYLYDGWFVVRIDGAQDNPKKSSFFDGVLSALGMEGLRWTAELYPVCDTDSQGVRAALIRYNVAMGSEAGEGKFRTERKSLCAGFTDAHPDAIIAWDKRMREWVHMDCLTGNTAKGVPGSCLKAGIGRSGLENN